jgi:hypothetical protein
MLKRQLSLMLLLAVTAALLPGCKIAPQRYSAPQVQLFTLAPGDLERHGLAFLTPSTVTGQEEDKQPLALMFSSTLSRERPSVRLLSLADTLSAVNRAGLTDTYKRMYQDYRDTGLFDPALLRQIGKATGARYAAQIKMAGFGQGNKGRFGVFGLSIFYTQTATIRLFLQIWDTQTGAIAWEGGEELTAAYDTLTEKAITLQSMVQDAAGELIRRLPCEPCPSPAAGSTGSATAQSRGSAASN